jgi:rare lipoprotein A
MKRIVGLYFIIISTLVFSISSYGNRVIEGYASWYGVPFHGRTTANGETYNMHSLTAAHRTLSFGTYVRVINLNNNKSVVVKINDRGPFKGNRVIDVSKEAAKQLGFINIGLTKVSITVLGKNYNTTAIGTFNAGNIKKALSEPPEQFTKQKKSKKLFVIKVYEPVIKIKKPHYKLQIGAFSNIEHAIKHQQKLSTMGIPSFVCFYQKDASVFRLLTKKTFNNKAKVIKAKQYIAKLGITAIIKKL